MGLRIVGYETAVVTSGTSISIGFPSSYSDPEGGASSLQADDLLLVFHGDQSSVSTSPYNGNSNFTYLSPSFVAASSDGRITGIWARVVTSASGEPSSYTFARNGAATRSTAAMVVVRGAPTASYVDAVVTDYDGDAATNGRGTAALTVTDNGGLQFFFARGEFTSGNSHVPSTAPSGFTTIVNHQTGSGTTASRSGSWVGYRTVDAGSTGTSTALWAAVSSPSAQSVVIRALATVAPVETVTATGGITLAGSSEALATGGTATLTATGGVTLSGSAAGDVSAGTPDRTATGGISLAGSATASAQGGTATRTSTGGLFLTGTATNTSLRQYPPQPWTVADMDGWIAKGYPVHWAHRGGSANWSEGTMYAYNNAVEHGARALEISVRRSLDGVFIVAHDDDLTRITATTYRVSATSSAVLLGLAVDAPSSGGVLCRLEDVLTAYPDRVLVVDNKAGSYFSDFLDILETVPDSHNQIIVKFDGQYGTVANFQAAKARGFKTAGYWYPNNFAAYLPDREPYCDYIGMQYDATSGEWAALAEYGKPLWGHVLQNSTQYNQAVAGGCSIFQLANVSGLMPAWNDLQAKSGVILAGAANSLVALLRSATAGLVLSGSTAVVGRDYGPGLLAYDGAGNPVRVFYTTADGFLTPRALHYTTSGGLL